MPSPYDRPAPIYVGFADGGVYEFTTTAGQYVYLHEAECVDMRYRPLARQLELTFECIESELMAQSTVILTFDDAEIFQWETAFKESGTADPAPRVRGQVGDLSLLQEGPHASNSGSSFHLRLFEVAVSFFASKATCNVQPIAGPKPPLASAAKD